MSRKPISPAVRRHQDYLRRQGLKVGAVYEARLVKLRRAEIRRVLNLARDYDSESAIEMCLQRIDERGYLPGWYGGLYRAAGLPMAESTAKDLKVSKADDFGDSDAWLDSIDTYARGRAAENVVIVSGTLKDNLIGITRRLMAEDLGLGVEKLTKRIYREYQDKLEKWMCRRIAQTETMIALGEAAAVAADTLDIAFTKQWCISGLGNTRDSHEIMDGVIVDQDELFELKGGKMRFPHDTSLGADASEIINCACACIRAPKKAVQQAADKLEDEQLDPEEQRIQEMMDEMSSDISEENRRAIALNNIELEKALKLEKGSPMGVTEADAGNSNPSYYHGKGYRINCSTCSSTYLMRTRGFDITAGSNTQKAGNPVYYLSQGMQTWEKWLMPNGKKPTHTSVRDWAVKKRLARISADDYYAFYDQHTKEPGVYEVCVGWQSGGGHSTILQRFASGELWRIDAQTGIRGLLTKKDSICENAVHSVASCWEGRGIMRIDDKLFNTKLVKIFKKPKTKK